MITQIIKFISTGIANTIVGLFVIYIFMVFNTHYVVANIAGYTAGLGLSYFLNRSWTFGATSKKWGLDLLRYVAVILLAYLANLAIIVGLVEKYSVPAYLAQLLGIIVYTFISFVGIKIFVFFPIKG